MLLTFLFSLYIVSRTYQTDFLYISDYVLRGQDAKKQFQSSIVIIQEANVTLGTQFGLAGSFWKDIWNIFLFHNDSVAVIEGIEIQWWVFLCFIKSGIYF